MTPDEVSRIQSAMKIKMPFGRYRGVEIEDIPSSYLRWAAENLDKDHFATACDIVWRYREEMDDHI